MLSVCILSAQPREEFFDFSFHPTKTSPYYYVTTEKKDSLWDQKAYYISTLKMASECFYKDEKCFVPHGTYKSYDLEGFQVQSGNYLNGVKQGKWLRYNTKGYIIDSSTYDNGHLKGIAFEMV